MTKRQAKKLEPITLDDLMGNSSMEGLVSFLDLPTRSSFLPHSGKIADPESYPLGAFISAPLSPVPNAPPRDQALLIIAKSIERDTSPLGSVPIVPQPTVPTGCQEGREYQQNETRAVHKRNSLEAVPESLQDTVGSLPSSTVPGAHSPEHKAADVSEHLMAITIEASRAEAVPESLQDTVGSLPSSTVPGAHSPEHKAADVSEHLMAITIEASRAAADTGSLRNDQQEPFEMATPHPVPTVARGFGMRVPKSQNTGQSGYARARWITEEGQIVSAKQVRPFRLAQEVLNANERALYSVLWNSKEGKLDPGDPNVKIVRAGYETLARQTNMAKKTIQRLVPRLLNKNFIEIGENPNFLNRTAAAYKVFSFKRVLEICAEQGRGHVAKLGHGVAFARPYPPGPVPDGPPITVGTEQAPTVRGKSPLTRDNDPMSTMARRSISLETTNSKEESQDSLPEAQRYQSIHSSSSSITEHPTSENAADQPTHQQIEKRREPVDNAAGPRRVPIQRGSTDQPAPLTLVEGIRQIVPFIDDEAISLLWQQCRSRANDCTAKEILHFSHGKASILRSGRIQNPTGFLLIAVPKCFEGSNFQQYRREEEQLRLAELKRAKQAEIELEDAQRQLEEMLNSPTSTEDDRRFAKQLLGLEGK